MAADTRSVVRLGIRSLLSPALTASGSYYLVAFNGSVAPALSARIDIERKPTSLLAGFALARRQRPPALLESVVAVSLNSVEVFAGCGFGRTSYRAQVIVNLSPPPGDANRVVVSVRIPLKRQAQPPVSDR
jgi:hypothetical protein